jgi:hypothetical protein
MFDEGSVAAVCPSFTSFLHGVQKETNVLKCLAQLRSLPPGDQLSTRLHEIEAAVRSIEQNMEEFNEFITGELNTCEILEAEALEDAEIQRAKIEEMEQIVVANRPPVTLVVEAAAAAASSSAKALQHKGIKCISSTELETVPKSTRGRTLTVGLINTALSHIKTLVDDKSKALQVPRKKMNQRQLKISEDFHVLKNADHGAAVFVTEGELRGTSIFDSGEATGKATLHTLRALHRLKMIRAATENTYVVL